MTCSNCGHICADGDKFCQNCGAQLTPSAPTSTPETPAHQTPPYDTFPAQGNWVMPSPIHMKLKQFASSPLLLTAIIAYTAYIVLTLCTTAFGSAISAEAILGALYDLGFGDILYAMDGEIMDMIYAISAPSLASTLFSMTPQILIALGMWLLFASAKSGQPKTTGLTIIKVITIIQLVGFCITIAALGIGSLLLLLAAFGYIARFGSYGVLAAAVALLIITVLIAVFGLLYYVKLLRSLEVIKQAIQFGTPAYNVRTYLIFYCWFSGICAIFGGLGGIAQAVACICFGLFLSKYKREMQAVCMNGNGAHQ